MSPAVADCFDSPVGTQLERNSNTVWPGSWYDATGYAVLYYPPSGQAYHTGADLNLPNYLDAHKPFYATANGVVVNIGTYPSWYNILIIKHISQNNIETWSRYAHWESVNVKVGDVVTRGQQIGKIGNASNTLPYHLHFDISSKNLELSPTDWPKLNLIRLKKDYFDPKIFIKNYHTLTTAFRGLQMRADGGSTQLDFDCITVAKLNACKIMSNTSFEEFSTLRSLVPVKNIVLRLFASGDNPSLGNPNQFFDEQKMWLTEFSKQGGLYVEIGNENNLPQEGYGTFWKTPQEFANFYSSVAKLIKLNFPTLKLVYPGLSPQANTQSFIDTIPSLINQGLVDIVAAHSYWVNAADMNSLAGGRYYRRYLNLGKPVLISEFANVGITDSDTIKGQQYKQYFNSLESNVLGAIAFVSSASDPIFSASRQTWVRNGVMTDIPKFIA